MVNIGTPCLVFSTLIETKLQTATFLTVGAAAAASVLIFYAVYYVVLTAVGLSRRSFLSPLVYGNVGNMGLPLCLLAFGQQGLAYAIAYFTVSAVSLFTIGAAISAGATSIGTLARLPILYAVVAALVVMVTGVPVPDWIGHTTHILGGLTVPLMLITLGVSLAGLQVRHLARAALLSVLRLGVGFVVGWGLAQAFGFHGAERGVLIIQCGMPVAVFTFLLAQKYDRHPEEVAGTVVVSTLMSFVTLPLVLAYVM